MVKESRHPSDNRRSLSSKNRVVNSDVERMDDRNRWRDGQVCPDGPGVYWCVMRKYDEGAERDFCDLPIRRDEGHIVDPPLLFKRVFFLQKTREMSPTLDGEKGRSPSLDRKNMRGEPWLLWLATHDVTGLVISAPSDPTIIPSQQNRVPAIIDLGLSCGLSNISVESRCELSSDHNFVHVVINFNFNSSHLHNCKTITNWYKYQDILTNSIAGNPPINSIEDIENAITRFNHNIHPAINQSSKFLHTKQASPSSRTRSD
ncbi:hypothetical protein TNCV_5054141 [Trichonephila clavipes]|nr:hypothetical protein TNCV_5054141 [Trichonephila clavipes]